MSRKSKKAKPRVTVEYVVTFTMKVEQDETGDDKGFDVENGIRVELECLQGNVISKANDGNVQILDIEGVGAVTTDDYYGRLNETR